MPPRKPMPKPPAPKREPAPKAAPKKVPQRDGLRKFAKSIKVC